MRRPHRLSLAAFLLGSALGLGVGCEPIDPIEEIPVGLSDTVCFRDSDCAPNRCCGEGTNPTHVSEAPNCAGVRCDGTCPPNTIDCGRCIPTCRDSRCAAACQ
ncbi:MAG TPA: hypothetical protein VNA24_06745 [Hyalangium sp.]|nr:hypothetical protein [Hyalangium sp.]